MTGRVGTALLDARRETTAGRAAGATAGGGGRRAQRWLAVVYLLPGAVLIGLWVVLPTAGNLVDSLTADGAFVGTRHYADLLAQPELLRAAQNTVLYAVALLPLTVPLPLAAGVAVHLRGGRAAAAYRVLLFAPVLIPPAIGAVMVQWILHPLLGVANAGLEALGIDAVNWLAQPASAFAAVVATTAWRTFGLSLVLFTGGLVTIDPGLIDAARVDGASEIQVARHVILPLLAPTVAFVTLVSLVYTSQWSFTAIDVLTQGGPRDATTNLLYLLYDYGFTYAQHERAAALGLLVLLVFGAAAALHLRAARSRDRT